MKSVIIRVSPKFAEKLKQKYLWFNENIAKNYFNKKITFTDFTDILANGFDETFDWLFGSKLLLYPLKKGRKSKRITFSPIPI
jgi:hypothetical protein